MLNIEVLHLRGGTDRGGYGWWVSRHLGGGGKDSPAIAPSPVVEGSCSPVRSELMLH